MSRRCPSNKSVFETPVPPMRRIGHSNRSRHQCSTIIRITGTVSRNDRHMDARVPDRLGKRSILSAAFFSRGREFGNSSSPRSPFPPSSRSEFDGGPVSRRCGPSFSLLCMSLIPYTSDPFAAFVLYTAVDQRRKCVGPLTLRVSRLGRRGVLRGDCPKKITRDGVVAIRKYLVPKKQHPFPFTDHEIAVIGKAAAILGTLIVKRYRFPKRASYLAPLLCSRPVETASFQVSPILPDSVDG